MNKFLNYAIWAVFSLGTIVLFGFVNEAQKQLLGNEIVIRINQNDENFFLEKKDIENILPFHLENFKNTPISTIEIDNIERQMNNHPAIANAEVFTSLEGNLNVLIAQRKPIARVFSSNQDSYYLDKEGYLMPLSEKFTSRVLIINGYVNEPYVKWYSQSMNQISKIDSLKRNTHLDELFKLSQFIYNNEFWKAQIEQLYVNKDLEVELIPRVGSHKIVFGEVIDIEKKFKKLMTFYEHGLNKTGWNEYKTINLKFENQVVCTKRFKQ